MPAAPYLRPMFRGRKGIGALRKELWETRDYSGRVRLPGGSGSGWVWRTGRFGHGETGGYEYVEQGRVQPASCDLRIEPG